MRLFVPFSLAALALGASSDQPLTNEKALSRQARREIRLAEAIGAGRIFLFKKIYRDEILIQIL